MSKLRFAVVAVSLGLAACAARTTSSTGAGGAPPAPPTPTPPAASVNEPHCAIFANGADAEDELASLLHEDGEGSWEMTSGTGDDGSVFACFNRPGQSMTFSGDEVVVSPGSSEPAPEVIVD